MGIARVEVLGDGKRGLQGSGRGVELRRVSVARDKIIWGSGL